MASAEARAGNTCFRQENFRMPHNFSDQPSKNLEPDFTYSDCDFVNNNSDMKWWLHVKTNLRGDANYTCQNLNYLESELLGGDQFVENFDPLSCVGSATNTIGVEQPWNVPSKCLKKCNDTGMLKIATALNNEFHLAPMKKNKEEFWFSNGEFVESDATSFLVYDHEQCKSMSSDMEPHWIGAEKTRPWWWRANGRHDLASLVAQKKSHEYTENCDLPEPHINPFRKILPVLQPREIDHDKNSVSSLNQKSEMCSSNVNGCTSGTLTSSCSFQDSERTFSSSESRESSDSNNKDNHINSESKNKAEILKALCHSQTRAREAEKAAQQAFNEKEHIISLFFKQASQLFAYKQWLHVLQLENLCLQLRNKNQVPLLNLFYKGKQHKKGSRKSKKRKGGIRKCVVAFAVGLALAGAGLLLGWNLGYTPLRIKRSWPTHKLLSVQENMSLLYDKNTDCSTQMRFSLNYKDMYKYGIKPQGHSTTHTTYL